MFRHWLADVFTHPTAFGALIIAGKTAFIYLFLGVGLRLLGKRQLGQMNIYDLVLVIVLANAVQNAMVGDDTSLAGGLVAALTLLILNRLVTRAMLRSPRLERLLVGEPVLIVNDGQLIEKQMRCEGVTREQVLAALREHGIEKLDQAHMCVLEVDGTISCVPQDSTVHKTRHHYKGLRLP
jgi:uncharacterized membrane protein YcaP (DUF421 family)